jgi:tetratricopeptide (TPR) repeat protein
MAEDGSSFWTDIQRFEDMLAADPMSRCFAALSELYRRIGLLDDAISTAEKGNRSHPDYYGGFLALGAACYDKGLNAEARRALERVLVLKPDDLRAQKILGQLYADAGETAAARRLLSQVLRQNPEDVESQLLLRTLGPAEEAPESVVEEPEDEVLEDLEIVDEELTEVIEEVEPQPAPAVRNLHTTATMADLYAAQGFLDRALAVYDELLQDDPANQTYRSKASALRERIAEQAEQAEQAQATTAVDSSPSPTLPLRGREFKVEQELESWLVNIGRRRDGA